MDFLKSRYIIPAMSKSDEKLIEDYLKGDEKALKILIGRYLKLIFGFAYQYVGNAKDAEDIAQETFVKAWRKLKSFDPHRSRFRVAKDKPQKKFKVWLFAIVKNTAIDFLRKKKDIPFSAFTDEEGDNMILENLVDPVPLASEMSERKSAQKSLESVIKKLSFSYCEVLNLYYKGHFNFREIAEILGKPLNTVKSRHRRALILLRKFLVNL